MNYQSEIRESEIESLLRKVQKRNYGRYLYKITLQRVRGFNDQIVTFDFPVTALIAPNGGGKTTILGAAYIAYKETQPRRFFSRSGNLDNSMQGWRIIYELINKESNVSGVVQRTASYTNAKWSRSDFLKRDTVIEFGISRTVPASERTELAKYARKGLSISSTDVVKIHRKVISAIARILGKTDHQYSAIKFGERGQVTLLSGTTQNGTTYSEFNFGAGESSLIRMLMEIEAAPEQSLVLIEEIENGLHPVATIRMVEYLIEVAARKRMQFIFTTHSNEALLPLPEQAIWAAIDWKVVQGKLNIASLRRISGRIETKLVVYVEDEFAKTWIKAILRAYRPRLAIDAIEIYPMGGDSVAVEMCNKHNQDPAQSITSICLLDGDAEQSEVTDKYIYKLPGSQPEDYVLSQVMAKFSEFGGKLAVALHQPFDEAEFVQSRIREVDRDTIDPHNKFAKIGEKLGLIATSTIEEAFVTIWTQAYPDVCSELVHQFENLLPVE